MSLYDHCYSRQYARGNVIFGFLPFAALPGIRGPSAWLVYESEFWTNVDGVTDVDKSCKYIQLSLEPDCGFAI